MKTINMILTVRNLSLVIVIALTAYSCQKELYDPKAPVVGPEGIVPKIINAPSDTLQIRAFYGHQGITPPAVGTVIFPRYTYEVPTANKLAFMSAYSGLNRYGDSAGTIKKNAMNEYNNEFYNNNMNAQGNAWITVTPLNHPVPDWSVVSADNTFAYDKFFSQGNQFVITIKLVDGVWEHCDTAANGQVTIYRMNKLQMKASESIETGLATRDGVQKLKNGQPETYLTFVNQRSIFLQPSKGTDRKPIAWYPRLFK